MTIPNSNSSKIRIYSQIHFAKKGRGRKKNVQRVAQSFFFLLLIQTYDIEIHSKSLWKCNNRLQKNKCYNVENSVKRSLDSILYSFSVLSEDINFMDMLKNNFRGLKVYWDD